MTLLNEYPLKAILRFENEDTYDQMVITIEGYYVPAFVTAITKGVRTITSHGYTNNWKLIDTKELVG